MFIEDKILTFKETWSGDAQRHKGGIEITKQQQWRSRERERGKREGDFKLVTEHISSSQKMQS